MSKRVKVKVVEINPSYAEGQEIVIKAQKLRASLSPYDIPQKVMTYYDEKQKLFNFDLQYLTPDEPKIETNEQDNIILVLGKNSGKVYGGRIINQEKTKLPGVRLIITAAIARLLEAVPEDRPSIKRMNYGLIKEFLEKEKEKTLY
jgi:hypothetical protein